ncbi:NAD(P)-binding domain-containing protein [Streptomyces sp. MST-110588]|uniref:NADPH-dependent F420 reductase n=1 Tax=Streptomyces sp. MST-110588 TaxID=2833628 RepID=UPI001F5D9B90|nr:NAD(P)-binding domain-containing protein [Streptomyces sp. MST-110588]UNO42951.1 NAD(P)-binding domain-containing protein [Streptomyces sp. MST-110588]
MRIGTLGAGPMAQALATQWARAGHEVYVGARDGKKAAALAGRIGGAAGAGSLREAAAFGEAVLLAVPYTAVEDALTAAGAREGELGGRTLIDCTNPLDDKGAPIGIEGGRPSAAAHIAEIARGARVVKAFNLCTPAVWSLTPPVFQDGPLAVPLCGDDATALETVRALVRDMGCEPMDVGGLDHAGSQEAALAFLAGLWFRGIEPRTALAPVDRLFG